MPLEAEPLPVTARPLGFGYCGIDLTGWEVTVDDQPGTVDWESPDLGNGEFLWFQIDPAPAEGEVVELRGCEYGCYGDPIEFDILRTFTVTGPDAIAPADPTLLALTHADEIVSQTNFDTGEEEMYAVRRWTVEFENPAADEPLAWDIRVGPSADTSTRHAFIMSEELDSAVITRTVADAGSTVCATVQALDLSGNVSQVMEVCTDVAQDDLLPEVPPGGGPLDGTGDSGDESSGGDDGSDGTGGGESGGSGDGTAGQDDLHEGSCACRADGEPRWSFGAWMGLLLLGLRRRFVNAPR
ncbi:MAG: hypothetical protein K0V04_10815 [Deltaproteobacteria bacterium]|nr:hypothetical protein [Deltaproteobacteria bacterium]